MSIYKFETDNSYGRWNSSIAVPVTKRTNCFVWINNLKKKIYTTRIDGDYVEYIYFADKKIYSSVKR